MDIHVEHHNQNVNLLDPNTIYISAALTLLLIKKTNPETPAKTSLVAIAEATKV